MGDDQNIRLQGGVLHGMICIFMSAFQLQGDLAFSLVISMRLKIQNGYPP